MRNSYEFHLINYYQLVIKINLYLCFFIKNKLRLSLFIDFSIKHMHKRDINL